MKTFVMTLFGMALILPNGSAAQARDADPLKFTLSAGVVSAPKYLGDNDHEIMAFPNVTVNYGDRLTASLDGIRYTLLSDSGLRIGLVGAYHFGRDEDPDDTKARLHGRATTDLLGLGDIDGTVELGGFISLDHQQISARAELRQGVDGGHDGLYGEVEVKYNWSLDTLGAPVFLSAGPVVAFGDDAYNSTFFNVSSQQALASGLGEYDADGGLISVGLHAAAVLQLSADKSLVGFAKFDQLGDEIAQSSLVKERGSRSQASAGVVLNFTF